MQKRERTVEEASGDSVISRPDRAAGTFVGLFGIAASCFYIGLVHFAPGGSPAPLALKLTVDLLFGGSLLASIGFLVWCWRAFVRADASGLTWRGGSATWDEVADYYLVAPSASERRFIDPASSSNTTELRLGIELRSGRKLHFRSLWTNRSAFQEVVARHATSAKTDWWGIKGGRLVDDLPRTLGYSFLAILPLAIMMTLADALLLGRTISGLPDLINHVSEMGWRWTLGFYGGFGLMIGVPFALFSLVILRMCRQIRERMSQRLTLSQEGLIFAEGERRVAATWAEVTATYTTCRRGDSNTRYVVETKNGSFDFNMHLAGFTAARALIAACVPWTNPWAFREDYSVKVTIQAPPGVTVFHYRTELNRMPLFLWTAIALMMPIVVLLKWMFDLPLENSVAFLLPTVPCVLAALWMARKYYHGRVDLTDDGIALHGPFGKGTLSWAEIEMVKTSGDSEHPGTIALEGGRTALRVDCTINDAKGLLAAVEQRTGKTAIPVGTGSVKSTRG